LPGACALVLRCLGFRKDRHADAVPHEPQRARPVAAAAQHERVAAVGQYRRLR